MLTKHSKGYTLVEFLIILAIAAAIIGVLYWMETSIEARGYQNGIDAQTKVDQAQHIKDQDAWDKKRTELQSKELAAQVYGTEQLTLLTQHYNQEKQNAQAKYASMLSDVRTGKLKLYDSTSGCGSDKAGGSGSSQTPSGGSPGDGSGGSELSGQASEFLLSEANRANDIARTLTTAQGIIKVYQDVCGVQQ